MHTIVLDQAPEPNPKTHKRGSSGRSWEGIKAYLAENDGLCLTDRAVKALFHDHFDYSEWYGPCNSDKDYVYLFEGAVENGYVVPVRDEDTGKTLYYRLVQRPDEDWLALQKFEAMVSKELIQLESGHGYGYHPPAVRGAFYLNSGKYYVRMWYRPGQTDRAKLYKFDGAASWQEEPFMDMEFETAYTRLDNWREFLSQEPFEKLSSILETEALG